MEKQRRLKAVILTTLIIGVLTISVAFSALSRTLNISGVGKMDTAKWDVRFENLREPEITRDAVQVTEPKIMDDGGVVGDINVKLTKPKDEISYKVDIANNGTIDAEVNVMTIADLTDDEKKLIDFGVYYQNGTKITKYDLLEAGEKRTIIIKIRYKDDITEFDLPTEPLEIKLSCQIDYVQSDAKIIFAPNGITELEAAKSILAEGNSKNATNTFFNGSIKKETVESITFVSTLKVPKDAQAVAWDASLNKDGSVVAWYTDSDDNELYELYIGGNGKVYAPQNSSNLFNYFTKLKEINFNNIFITNDDSYGITSMSYMFAYCSSLTSLDLSSFETTNVKSMGNMFANCGKIASLDLGSFDTSNVTDMSGMFHYCSLLKSLDLNHFDTSNVTNMYGMFWNCWNLSEIDLSSFDTSNVTNMFCMFANCISLTTIDLSSFDTSKVTDMSSMFQDCKALTSLDLNNFNTSKVEKMYFMFLRCESLIELNVSNFDTSKVTDMFSMFSNCTSLTSLDLSKWKTQSLTDMKSMFHECSSLTSLDLSSFDTSNVTRMYKIFNNCRNLISLNLSAWNTSEVTDMSYMFNNCSLLTSLDLSLFDTSKVTDMSYMFNNCSLLTSLDLSSFDTSKVTDMSYMFNSCIKLKNLVFNNANFDKVTKYSNMLYNVPTGVYIGIRIYVKDEAAKTFILARKSDANVIIGAPTAYNYSNINDKLYLSI